VNTLFLSTLINFVMTQKRLPSTRTFNFSTMRTNVYGCLRILDVLLPSFGKISFAGLNTLSLIHENSFIRKEFVFMCKYNGITRG